MSKPRSYSISPFNKNWGLLFALFQRFLVKDRVGSQVKELQSKSIIAYTGAINPGLVNPQKVWSYHFPFLQAMSSKNISEKF